VILIYYDIPNYNNIVYYIILIDFMISTCKYIIEKKTIPLYKICVYVPQLLIFINALQKS